jgi:hypothetical protein
MAAKYTSFRINSKNWDKPFIMYTIYTEKGRDGTVQCNVQQTGKCVAMSRKLEENKR